MTTYDEADEALHRSWKDMVKRCHGAKPDPRCEGISVHLSWRSNYREFRDYVNHTLGPRPDGFYLKRINLKGDFEPGNLHYVDPKQRNVRDTKAEQPYARATATADGRFRALVSVGTYETEGEALTTANDVLAYLKENYS